MRITNGDVELFVAEDGDPSAPPVVVLHGITMSTATWDWLVPLLADRHRVLRLDFRGHGSSDRAPDQYHLPGYLSDAIAVCEQVAGAPAIVIGHSLGGVTGAALAQQRPDLVRAFLLEDPALSASDIGSAGGAGRATDTSTTVGSADHALTGAFARIRDVVPLLQGSGLSAPELVERMRDAPTPSGTPQGATYHEDALHGMAASLLNLDASVLDAIVDPSAAATGMGRSYDHAQPIAAPGVVLAGDPSQPDTVVRAVDIDRLAQHNPHVRTEVVAGAGHMIHDHLVHRQRMIDELEALLSQLDG